MCILPFLLSPHMSQGPHKAVVGLLNVACLPVALPESVPGVYDGRIVLDGPREVLLCLGAVVREDVQDLSTEVPVLYLGEGRWSEGAGRDIIPCGVFSKKRP